MYKENGQNHPKGYARDHAGERASTDGDGIITLIRETADGFGHLIGDHIKLARLELVGDVKEYGGQLAIVALIVPIVFLGYGLACVGLAVLLSRWLGRAGAFFLVGGAHVVLGSAAIAVATRRIRRVRPMQETADAVSRSVDALTVSTGSVDGNGVLIDHRGPHRGG